MQDPKKITVYVVALGIMPVERIQCRVVTVIIELNWVDGNVLPQLLNIFFHNITVLKKVCVMLTLISWNYKSLMYPKVSTLIWWY